MTHRDIVEQIYAEDPNILKEIILRDSHLNDRLLVQIGCVNKFKFEESNRQKRDIGWSGAWELWVNRGYAKRFAEVYSDEVPFRTIYSEVMNYTN